MTFQKYTKSGNYGLSLVSINPKGLIYLPHKLESALTAEYVVLWYDSVDKLIKMQPATKSEEGALRIIKNARTGVVSATGFLKFFGISIDQTIKVAPNILPNGSIILSLAGKVGAKDFDGNYHGGEVETGEQFGQEQQR